MIRTLAIAVALFTAAPVFAAELIVSHSETSSIENTGTTEAAKPKRKPAKADTADYLVVTLKDASITSY